MISVRSHGVASNHNVVLRTRRIADQAARLVSRKVGRLPHVEIVVTDKRGVTALVEDTEAALVGSRVSKRRSANIYGSTALAANGVLITINAGKHRDDLELDTTVIHELVHAVQLNRPGAREQRLAELRNNYGVEEMRRSDARKAIKAIKGDEKEARTFERLARHLK